MSPHLSINEIYQNRRDKNEQIRQKRISDLYQLYPELKEYDKEINILKLQTAKTSLSNKTAQTADSYEAQLLDITEKRKQLLASHNIEENYLSPIYTCPLCHDYGYIEGNWCNCYIALKAKMLFDSSPIKRQMERENFDTFDFSYYSDQCDGSHNISARENIKEAYDAAKAFADAFPSAANMLFQGPTGVGKTFLTNCIAREVMKKGYYVCYLPSSQYFEILADHAFRYSQDKDEKYQFIIQSDLLIIDDLGTELTNAFVDSSLFDCINERTTKGKSTIISTNLTMNQIASTYSKRISSRIIEHFSIYPIFGKDIRLIKRRNTLNP